MSIDFDFRVMLFLEKISISAGHGFWVRLAEQSKISAKTWSNLYSKKQKATPAILEVMVKLRPEWAFWLMTGITDCANGHTAPGGVITFPEKNNVVIDSLSPTYFKLSIEIYEDFLKCASLEPGTDAAHLLTGTEKYEVLSDLWVIREENRSSRIAMLTGENRTFVGASEVDVKSGKVHVSSHSTLEQAMKLTNPELYKQYDLFYDQQHLPAIQNYITRNKTNN